MTNFGWWYPPGAASDPSAPYNQDDGPCPVCGQMEENCICTECPKCGAIGDPFCYDGGKRHQRNPRSGKTTFRKRQSHGMVRTSEQIASLAKVEAIWKMEADSENAAYAEELAAEAEFLRRNPPQSLNDA